MPEIEEYPETVVEIMRTLYFSGKLQASSDLRKALEKRGIAVETRTIRYHLTNLEKSGLVRRFG
ncbi:MAG: ribonuclease R, partial [Synergistaceae bacterium]|nr:ribonuclease R [Synergistaceae bacterium]